MLRSVVRSVGTFSELDKVWDFYKEYRSDRRSHFANESVWIDALTRVRNAQSGSVIRHVRMAPEMYTTLECQNPAHQVATDALLSLKTAGIEPDDELECRLALAALEPVGRHELELSLEQRREANVRSREENLLPAAKNKLPEVVQERQRIEVINMCDRIVDQNDRWRRFGAVFQCEEYRQCKGSALASTHLVDAVRLLVVAPDDE